MSYSEFPKNIQLRQAGPANVSEKFLQGMVDRVTVGRLKYGSVEESSLEHHFMRSAQKRLDEYDRTGNTEMLMDAANFLMLEFLAPSHPKAHFHACNAEESPKVVRR